MKLFFSAVFVFEIIVNTVLFKLIKEANFGLTPTLLWFCSICSLLMLAFYSAKDCLPIKFNLVQINPFD